MTTYKLYMFVWILCFVIIRTSADISLAEQLYGQENFKNNQILFDLESQKNGTLHYMFCPPVPSDLPLWSPISCTIFREEHNVDKLPRITSCNASFAMDNTYDKIGPTMRILPLNQNKTLILWVLMGPHKAGPFLLGTANLLKYTLVDYNTCETNEFLLSTRTDIYEIKIDTVTSLAYPSAEGVLRSTGFTCFVTFCEISFRDLPCGAGYCKRRIDKNTGELISEEEHYYTYWEPDNLLDIVPAYYGVDHVACIFFDRKAGNIYKLKNSQGLDQILWSESYEDWEKFRYSVRYGTITICKAIEETKIKCKQIQSGGAVTMRNEFDLQKRNLDPVPYTWRGGGYLLLTTECDTNCTEVTYRLYAVDTDGDMDEVNDIEGFKCDVNKFTQWNTFFENNQGKHCISLLCYHSNIPKEVLVHCYNLSEN